MSTSSDTEDRTFKKYLTVSYSRTFIYSVINAFDEIFAH